MGSKEEIARLLAALAGALLGVGTGLSLLMLVYSRVPALSRTGGIAPILVILGLCIGGLIGGGWVGLWLVTRRQKVQRKKYFDDKKKQRKGKR